MSTQTRRVGVSFHGTGPPAGPRRGRSEARSAGSRPVPGRAPHGVLRRLPKAAESVRLWWAREEISGLQRGVLALCLTAGLLCGCGGGSNAVTGSPSSPATSAQSSDSAADQSMAEKTVGRLSDLTSRWQVLLPRDDPIVAAEMACVRSVGRGGLTAEHAGDLFSSGDPTVLVGGKPFSHLPKVVTPAFGSMTPAKMRRRRSPRLRGSCGVGRRRNASCAPCRPATGCPGRSPSTSIRS